jgi:predicted nucleic acid-binding protein
MSPRGVLSAAEPDPRWFRSRPPRDALIDSGPLIALFNRADRWHPAALAWLESNQHVRLHSTWPVMTEVCALLARRVHNLAALDFLDWAQRGALRLDHPPDGALGLPRRRHGLVLRMSCRSIETLMSIAMRVERSSRTFSA